MKKIVTLVLILGVCSIANAGMSISIHEVGGGTYTGRTLAVSDYLWLDITAESNGIPQAQHGYWALICDPGGAISGGIADRPAAVPPDGNYITQADAGNLNDIFAPAFGYLSYFPVPEGWDGANGMISDTGGKTLLGVQIEQMLFHCESASDVTVNLIWTNDYATFYTVDTVVIPQVPEPATMILLSLGGLLLRRFKK